MIRILCCSLVLVACGSAAAKAADCCEHCDHCGCQSCCHKVCRLVCETKKVPKVTYSCECEDFCVPGPSDHCVTCDECGRKKHVYTPTCAHVRTRTKLVKHETMEEVPSHKWVVETICDACAAKCGTNAIPQDGGPSVLHPAGTQRLKATLDGSARAETAPTAATQVSSNEAPSFAAQLRRIWSPALGRN